MTWTADVNPLIELFPTVLLFEAGAAMELFGDEVVKGEADGSLAEGAGAIFWAGGGHG